MSTPVTYVANQYNIPAYQDTGYAQGAGNLSSYLIALATGSLTLSGGSFTLTADADFGTGFGLKSIYYKSRATNPATTGVVRLGSAEVIAWRNNANSGNLPLTTDASDRLTFDGFVIATSTGALVGTNLTLTDTSNQMLIGTTNTTTLSFTAPASSRTYTVPDAGGNVQFVMAGGTQTIAGAKTFSSAVSLTAASNQLVFNPAAGNTVTINLSSTPASSVVYTLPDAGGAASFVMTAGTQTIAGAKTFSSAIAITATSNHLVLSTASNTLTINANAQAGSARTWSIPDISAAGTFAALEGTQTFSGTKTFSASVNLTGAVSNGNISFTTPGTQGIVGQASTTAVTAGNVGEIIQSQFALTNTGASGVEYNATSIPLTAGHWLIYGNLVYNSNGATFTSVDLYAAISTTSGNSSTGEVVGQNASEFRPGALTTFVWIPLAIPAVEAKLSGPTTYYLKGIASVYTVGTPQAAGSIVAVRIS